MHYRPARLILAAAVLTIIALLPIGTSAFGVTGGALVLSPSDPTTTQVSILKGSGSDVSSAGYFPVNAVVVIGVNNTINWTNDDSALHTATSTDGAISSGDLRPGQSYTVTLSTPGTYSYSCVYHSWMHGTIAVKSNLAPVTTTTTSSSTTTNSSTTSSTTSTNSTTSAIPEFPSLPVASVTLAGALGLLLVVRLIFGKKISPSGTR